MAEEPNFRVVRFADLITDLITENDIAVEARRTGRAPGPVTQLKLLDQALGGCLAKGLHILQSGPGAGKTALAMQIGATCGFPCLYISAEMPITELFRRAIARSTSTFLGRLKSGELSSQDIEKLARRTAEQSPWFALLDATTGYVTPKDIRDRAEALAEQAKASGVLVVLDSLQYWARGVRDLPEYEAISHGVREMAEVAAHLASPIIVISHRNRAGNKGEGGMYAGKGSGDLEYSAESIIELTRAKGSKPDLSGKVTVDLDIHKNRHGEPGASIRLDFTGRLQLFTEESSDR